MDCERPKVVSGIIAYGPAAFDRRAAAARAMKIRVRIDGLGSEEYARLLQPIWSYLCRSDPPVPSDVIFVFGSRGLEVPRRAAQLFAAGWAPLVLVSGRAGPMTERVFDRPEALVFKDELVRRGVPAAAVVTEVDAGNTLENVRFGMAVLAAAGHRPRSALLVAKAFAMRRCLATFARQHSGVKVRGCPPAGALLDHLDRSRADFAARLVAEIRRLDVYGAAGDIAPCAVPPAVRVAARETARLLEPRRPSTGPRPESARAPRRP